MRISDLHRRILVSRETRYIATFDTTKTSAGSSASNQLALPLLSSGGTYNFTVEWGDGTSDLITSGTQAERIHTYASAGVYDIKISGLLRGWRFAGSGDRLKILNIKNWGKSVEYDSVVAEASGAHFGCSNLDFTATDMPVFLGSIAGFFRGCGSLIGNSSINNWDVINCASFVGTFRASSNFNQNIGSWNVSNTTNFSRMFSTAPAFNQNIGGWNISKASNLTEFMSGKNPSTFSAANLDAIYNGWSQLTFVNTGLTTTFGTAKYTAAGQAGRDILTGAPNNWNITDGGI
jgi:hypothetical protein